MIDIFPFKNFVNLKLLLIFKCIKIFILICFMTVSRINYNSEMCASRSTDVISVRNTMCLKYVKILTLQIFLKLELTCCNIISRYNTGFGVL